VVASTALLGGVIGGISAMAPGWLDAVIMRSMDILLSVPALVLAMALAAALGPGLLNAMVALIVARLPAFVRLARNQSLLLRRQGYVEFAQLNGAGPGYTLRRHIAPNVAPPIIVQAASDISGVMLAAAALGFIGLGAQPPTPEWGALAASGRLYFLDAWWYAVFPAAAMLAATAGFTLLGDAARDFFDPRHAQRSWSRQ
jgi:peptide/nickel transport system permease protein